MKVNSLIAMKRGDHISEELAMMDAPILRSLSGEMPFVVPAGYFEGLRNDIALHIAIEQEPEITVSWGLTLPFRVPDAYFTQLPSAVLDRVAIAESRETTTELSARPAFNVPARYFEQFPANVMERIRAEEYKARIPVQRPKKVSLFHNLRLAASVALIIFAGFGILRINNNMAPRTTAGVDFNTVSRSVISDYVIQNIDDFDTELIVSSMGNNEVTLDPALDNGTSKADIEAYLNEDGWN